MANYKQFHRTIYLISPDKAATKGVMDIYKVTKEMKKWYDAVNKYGYLVQVEGKTGFLYVVRESHTGQPSNAEGYKMAVTHGNRTPDNVMEFVCEAATILAEQPYDVYVGNRTAYEKQHELGIFFPYGTDKNLIMQTIEVINETMKEVAFKKWNSLVDVLIYG